MNSPLKPHGTIHGLIAGLVNHKHTRFGKGNLGPLPLAVNLEKENKSKTFQYGSVAALCGTTQFLYQPHRLKWLRSPGLKKRPLPRLGG
jgi:hypothetical protein